MKYDKIRKNEMEIGGVPSSMVKTSKKGNLAFNINKYYVKTMMVILALAILIGFGMPGAADAVLSVKQGTFVKNSTSGAQAITGVGFQPKAVIFYWTKQTATGYLANYSSGYGFAADGAPITMAAVSIQALDNQATTDANNYHSNAAAIALQNTASGGSLNNLGTITAFGADGFTLNWSAAGQADRISYIALGGTDITNAKVGTTSMFAATGASSVTGVGFQPDTAFLLSSVNGNTLNTVTASLRTGLTFGFMSTTSGTTQGSLSVGNRDARTATGYIGGVWSNTNYTNLRATAADVVATWSSWNADGFTMNATAAPNGAHNVSWLALQGGLFKLGSLAQRTSTGTQSVTGVGFQPLAAIFASANLNSASGTVSTTAAKQSFGIAAATQSGQWIGSAGTINSDENMNSSSTAAITLATGPTTTNAVASLSTLDADGFTLNWTTADATARNVLYVVMGSSTPPGDTVNVADGTDPANYNVARGSIDNVADSFTMVSTNTQDGAAAVTGVTASLTNSANISGIRLYKDNGVVGTYESGTDTLLSTGTPGASVSFTGFTENLTTTASNYLILADVASGATLAQTVVASVTALTVTVPDSQGTITDTGATLTIIDVPHENAGTALNTAIATSPKTESTLDVLMQRFQVTSSTSGAGAQDNQLELNSLGIDDLGTATGARTAKAYIDSTSSATLPGTAVLIGSVSSWTGAPTSITLNQGTAGDRTVANGTPKYIYIVYDLPAGATQTVQSSITSVGVVSPDAGLTGLTLNSSAITLNADPSKLTSCAGCHGYGATFTDGSARNNPVGTFPGSHNKHVATYSKACSVCHVAPATETSADFKHRDGTVQIAGTIYTAGAYSKTSFAQANTFTPGTCSNTYCHSNGTSVITASIPANTSPSWGGSVTCSSCHGNPADDGRPNYANGTPKRNTHGDGVSYGVTHKATACTTCHTGVAGTPGLYTISDTTTHNNGAYNLQATLGYTQATGVCATPGCHGSATWGGTLGCVDCHAAVQTGTHGTPRDAVVAEFGLTWGHKAGGKTPARGVVVNSDCIVCHLEGNFTTQTTTALHKDGNIDLRDPDGVGEVAITNMTGGAFTFTKFATSYAAGSRTSTGNTSNNADNVLSQKFCLACHDSNGATNTTARTTYGTPTAAMPFGGVALGANYTAANGAIGTQGLIDVKSQFATTNRSSHPILGAKNKDYATAARMNDPYKPTGTRGTSGTRSLGVIMNCFDCHNVSGASPLTTRTVAAHGNAETIRGVATVSGTPSAANDVTFCKVCHAGYAAGGNNHASGSAFTNSTDNGMTAYVNYGCNICHSSGFNTVVPRPIRAQDTHGSNTLGTVGTLLATQGRWSTDPTPIAFIRDRQVLPQHAPRIIGTTTYNGVCMGGNTSPCSQGTQNYTPGGTY